MGYKIGYIRKDNGNFLTVENKETGLVFNFNRPIRNIHNVIRDMADHLNSGGPLFHFTGWSG